MSNEERQRILREAGSRPAEAEKEDKAREAKQAREDEPPRKLGRRPPTEEPRPLPEDPGGPPRPRR